MTKLEVLKSILLIMHICCGAYFLGISVKRYMEVKYFAFGFYMMMFIVQLVALVKLAIGG